MSRIKLNQSSINQKITDKINEARGYLKRDKALTDAANQAVRDIKTGARTGRGFTKPDQFGGQRAKFPPLAKSTIDARGYLQETPQTLDPSFRKARSNLTISGQLLSSIIFEIKRGVVRIFANSKKRKRYANKGLRQRKTRKAPPTNEQVAKGLEDQGRYFIGIDDNTIKRIKTILIRNVRRILRG